MDKSPPKHLDNQSNQISRIHRHINLKRPKKPHQQSAWKTEAIKANAIMKQLDYLDGNLNGSNTNINQFVPPVESYNEGGTKHRTKPKSPIIVLSEDYEEDKNKGE